MPIDADRLNGRTAWLVTGLLFVCQAINYFDKTVLGLAASFIMKDLGLSPAQYGLAASSFFSLYAISGVVAGLFVANRVSGKRLLALLVLVWTVAQLPVLLASGLTALVASRLLLGVGEGPANPTAISLCHGWFTNERRGMPTATIMVGGTIGSLISAPLLTWVITGFGWRAGFGFCAALSLVWLLIWLALGADPPVEMTRVPSLNSAPARPIQSSIWLDRTIIGQFVAGFCAFWALTFVTTWVAPMLTLGMGFAPTDTGWLIMTMQAFAGATLMTALYLSQRALRRGASSRRARSLLMAWTMLATGAALAGAAFVDGIVLRLVLIAIGSALPTITATMGMVVVSEVAPPHDRSRVVVTIGSLVTVAGFIVPIVTGYLVGGGGQGGYSRALLVNGLVALVGSLAAFTLSDPERSLRERRAAGDPA